MTGTKDKRRLEGKLRMRDGGKAASNGAAEGPSVDPSVQGPPPPEAREPRSPQDSASSSPLREAARGSVAEGFDCTGSKRALRHGLPRLPQGAPPRSTPPPTTGSGPEERPRVRPHRSPFLALADPDPDP